MSAFRNPNAKRPGVTFATAEVVGLGLYEQGERRFLPLDCSIAEARKLPRFACLGSFARAVIEGSVREGPPDYTRPDASICA